MVYISAETVVFTESGRHMHNMSKRMVTYLCILLQFLVNLVGYTTNNLVSELMNF